MINVLLLFYIENIIYDNFLSRKIALPDGEHMRVELTHLITLIVNYTLLFVLGVLLPRDVTRLKDNSRKLYAGMLIYGDCCSYSLFHKAKTIMTAPFVP